MRNLGSILAVTLLLLTGFEESLNAQPYFYGYRPREDSRYALVYRINLATGQEEPFLPDSMRISSVWSDPGQKWVYVDERGRLLVVDADNPSVVHMPLGSGPTGGIDGILYVPQLNRFYISWVEGTGGGGETNTGSFDGSSFAMVDSSLDYIGSDAIVSEDASTIYQPWKDSSGHPMIYSFSVTTNSAGDAVSLSDIGPPIQRKSMYGGVKGRILIGFNLPSDEMKYSSHYEVVDLGTGQASTDILVPWKSVAHLTGDAKTIVVEEVSLALSLLGNRRYHTGNVFVFDASSGKLRHLFSFPPDGVVMVFDDYPDKFFYYNELTKYSSFGNVTGATPVSVFIDSLVARLHQADEQRWVGGSRFVEDLTHLLENAKHQLETGDSVGSAQQIESFQSRIWKEYHDKHRSHDRQIVTEDGYKSVYFFSGYVIGRLIDLPLKPFVSLTDQLDSLREEIKRQETAKNLEGTALVKGLKLLVDHAQRSLQKQDSVKTSRQLRLFQSLVEEVNDLTREGWKKNKNKKEKRHASFYLNEDAYIALYYRAKYIIEALPASREEESEHPRRRMNEEPELVPLGKELDSLKSKLQKE